MRSEIVVEKLVWFTRRSTTRRGCDTAKVLLKHHVDN